MTKFLKKTALFGVLLLLYFVINLGLNKIIINTFEIPIKEKRVMIVGDSHTRRALKPSLFDSAENISQQSELYILTYWKLKYILKNRKVDTLLIGFSPHNLSTFNDYKFYDKKWSTEMFKRSYFIGDLNSLEGIKVNKKESHKVYFQQMLLFPNFYPFKFIGNYKNSDKNEVDDAGDVIKRHFYYEGQKMKSSEKEIAYLDSIIQLSRKKNINPILVSTPVSNEYYNKIPKTILERYNTLKIKYKNQNIRVVDMIKSTYNDTLFFNSDHLNEYGAMQFTKTVIDSIKLK